MNSIIVDFNSQASVESALKTLLEKTGSLAALKANITKFGEADCFGRTEEVFSFNFGEEIDGVFHPYKEEGEDEEYSLHIQNLMQSIEERKQRGIEDDQSLQIDINRCEAMKYSTNEEMFFEQVQNFPALIPSLHDYVAQLESLHRQYDIPETTNYGGTAGLDAAQSLLKCGAEYTEKFVDFLCAARVLEKNESILELILKDNDFTEQTCRFIFTQVLMHYRDERTETWRQYSADPRFINFVKNDPETTIKIMLNAIVDTSFSAFLTKQDYANKAPVFIENLSRINPEIPKALEEKNIFPDITSSLIQNNSERLAMDLLPNQIEVDIDNPESVTAAIERLIEIVSDIDQINAVTAENNYSQFEIDLVKRTDTGELESYDVYNWEELLVNQSENADHLLREYGQMVIWYNENTKDELFINDEEYAGSNALLHLAMKDELDILWMIRFLRTNDLNHEVYQGEHITSVINKHGWTNFTLQLAAARATMPSQFGWDDLETYLKEDALKEYLQDEASIIQFCQFLNWSFYHHFERHDLVDDLGEIIEENAPELLEKFKNYCQTFAANCKSPIDLDLEINHIAAKVNYPKERARGIYQNIARELQTPYGLITNIQTTSLIKGASFDYSSEELFFSTHEHYYSFCRMSLEKLQGLEGRTAHYLEVDEIAIDRNGKVIVVAALAENGCRRLQFIDRESGRMIIDREYKTNKIAISPDGKIAATSYDDMAIVTPKSKNAGLVTIWDINSGSIITELREHRLDVRDLIFSPDGKYLITTEHDMDGCTYAWNTNDWSLHGGLASKGHSLAYNSDGSLIAMVGHDSTMVFSIPDCMPYMLMEKCDMPHEPYYVSVTFSPDDKYLIVGDSGSGEENEEVGLIHIFEVNTGQLIKNYGAHTDSVDFLDIHPKRNWLMSGGRDNLIKLWNFDAMISAKSDAK